MFGTQLVPRENIPERVADQAEASSADKAEASSVDKPEVGGAEDNEPSTTQDQHRETIEGETSGGSRRDKGKGRARNDNEDIEEEEDPLPIKDEGGFSNVDDDRGPFSDLLPPRRGRVDKSAAYAQDVADIAAFKQRERHRAYRATEPELYSPPQVPELRPGPDMRSARVSSRAIQPGTTGRQTPANERDDPYLHSCRNPPPTRMERDYP